jgi:hypothetical protein
MTGFAGGVSEDELGLNAAEESEKYGDDDEEIEFG